MTRDWKEIATSPIVIGAFVVLWIGAAIFGFIDYFRTDPDLKDGDRIEVISAAFEKEIEGFGLPGRTAINESRRRGGKRLVAITCGRRYRTELVPEEFESFFRDRLVENGWTFKTTDPADGPYERSHRFSRGKYEATISLENRFTLFRDGGTYFVVELSLRRYQES